MLGTESLKEVKEEKGRIWSESMQTLTPLVITPGDDSDMCQ